MLVCLQCLPFVLVFVSFLTQPRDSDLGWHLKYGEYFWQHHSLLQKNTFSTEMPDYLYTNTGWGVDILTYAVFHLFGFWGLAFLGALIATLIFYFFSQAARLTLWQKVLFFPLLIVLSSPSLSVSFRGEHLSILALGILLFLIKRFETKKDSAIFFTIPLFLVWANFHGEFPLGLAIFLFWISFRFFGVMAKERLTLLSSFVLAFMATLLNPYGFYLYRESVKHVFNPIKETIVGWSHPPIYSLLWWYIIAWVGLFLLSIFLLLKWKKMRHKLFVILLSLPLFWLAFQSRRYIVPLFFLSSPVVAIIFQAIRPRWKIARSAILASILVLWGGYLFYHKLPLENLPAMSWERYCLYERCSPSSARFLEKHHLTQKLFSSYDWGGWLIWNYPHIKPSVDGRMGYWEDETGYNAYARYYLYANDLKNIDDSSYDVVYMPPYASIHERIKLLEKERKWKIVYWDQQAFVAVRLPNSPASRKLPTE